MPQRVAIIYKMLSHYRLPFFNQLRERLAQAGIELRLIYSDPVGAHVPKQDTVEADWAIKVPARLMKLGKYEAIWQACLPHLHNVDLVVVEQASKLLVNYWLLLTQYTGRRKLAFWGHGRNLQVSSATRLGEWTKRKVSSLAHWWFAYNAMSAGIVKNMGFPAERITVVNNSIDTVALRQQREAWLARGWERIRAATGISSPHTCLYCGSLYPDKRLPFLLAAGDAIQAQVPDFQLVIMGAGPDTGLIRQAAERRPWLRYVGPRFGDDRIPFWLISKLTLAPAAVGLVILDAFVFGVPVVTLAGADHGPEIDYARNAVNSVILEAATTPADYATVVARYLSNEMLRGGLVAGCLASSLQYSIEKMAENFCAGVVAALQPTEENKL